MFFTSKNLNWEIITKDLGTFKLLKDEMKDEKFFKELCKNPKYRGKNWLKRWGGGEGFDDFLIYEGLGKKEGGLVFLRVGWYTNVNIYTYIYVDR